MWALLTKLFGGLGKAATGVGKGIAGAASAVGEGVGGLISGAGESAGGLISGAGDAIGGVGNAVGSGLKDYGQGFWNSLTPIQTNNNMKQDKLNNFMDIIKNSKSDEESNAGWQALSQEFPDFAPILEAAKKAREKQQANQQTIDVDKAEKLAKIAGNIDLNDDVRGMANDAIKKVFSPQPISNGPVASNQNELSPKAMSAISGANQWIGSAGDSNPQFMVEPQPNQGPQQPQPQAQQPGIFSRIGSAIKTGFANSDMAISGAGYIPETAPAQQYPDNKNMFTSGVNPFQSGASPETIQSPPASFSELGITDRNAQQALYEVEKALPDVDIRSELRSDPEAFKMMFDLLKTGKITQQEIIDFFKSKKR